jgi:hypothetical protein
LIFLSSLAIVVPNTDLSDRVDPPLSFIRRQLDPFASIRLGALRQLLQCNIMTACGGRTKCFSISKFAVVFRRGHNGPPT